MKKLAESTTLLYEQYAEERNQAVRCNRKIERFRRTKIKNFVPLGQLAPLKASVVRPEQRLSREPSPVYGVGTVRVERVQNAREAQTEVWVGGNPHIGEREGSKRSPRKCSVM